MPIHALKMFFVDLTPKWRSIAIGFFQRHTLGWFNVKWRIDRLPEIWLL